MVRSDKKRDVKPTLQIELKDAIYCLSYILKTPVKDVSEWLVLNALKTQEIIVKLVGYFKRDYVMLDGAVLVGRYDREQYPKIDPGRTEKITVRFKQVDYARIYDLSYCLGVSPSRATAILLDLSFSHIPTVNKCLQHFVKRDFDENELREFKKLNKYVAKKATM